MPGGGCPPRKIVPGGSLTGARSGPPPGTLPAAGVGVGVGTMNGGGSTWNCPIISLSSWLKLWQWKTYVPDVSAVQEPLVVDSNQGTVCPTCGVGGGDDATQCDS